MSNLPYYKFMVADWLSGDIQMMDHQTKGIAVDLFAQMWRKGGTLPDDDEYLARLIRCDKQCLSNALAELKQAEVVRSCEDGTIFVSFILEQLEELTELHEKRVAAGRKGGASKAKAKLKPGPSTKKQKKKQISDDAIKLAKFLIERVSKACNRKLVTNEATSAAHIDKLLAKDITPKDVQETILWLCNENMSNDYQFVVHSGAALVDKWDKIQVAMGSSKKKPVKVDRINGKAIA